MADKPAYRVPSMDEISGIGWNGFTAVSTFSGCGGSCLGYRMAGFRVAWASEFIPAAVDTYRANSSPGTVLDVRDIRQVSGADIIAAAGGEIHLFDGSPPCASFSTAGKREAGWGKVKKYSDTRQRVDDLFFEYARLIGETQPLTFVAENVAGLVKGAAKGYFKMILASLKECGYRVEARLLNAAWLGVPQSRPRLIFIGIRDDLGAEPVFPRPLPYRYTVRDALPWIIAQGDNGGYGSGGMREATVPSPTIGASPDTGNGNFPASKVIAAPGARMIHDTSGDRGLGDVTDRPSPAITIGVDAVNSRHYQIHTPGDDLAHDPETGESISIGRTTSPDGRCARRLTLAELRRIGGFPDDFVLTGTYAQRWERIGRAVPPVMMSHIAGAVRDGLLIPLREAGRI